MSFPRIYCSIPSCVPHVRHLLKATTSLTVSRKARTYCHGLKSQSPPACQLQSRTSSSIISRRQNYSNYNASRPLKRHATRRLRQQQAGYPPHPLPSPEVETPTLHPQHRLLSPRPSGKVHPQTAVEMVEADLALPTNCAPILKDVTAIYHIGTSFHPRGIEIGSNMIDAAIAGSVRHFVYPSVLHPGIEEVDGPLLQRLGGRVSE